MKWKISGQWKISLYKPLESELRCFLQLSQSGDKWLFFLNTTVKPASAGSWSTIHLPLPRCDSEFWVHSQNCVWCPIQSWLILQVFCFPVDSCKATLRLQIPKSTGLLRAMKGEKCFYPARVKRYPKCFRRYYNLEEDGAVFCPIIYTRMVESLLKNVQTLSTLFEFLSLLCSWHSKPWWWTSSTDPEMKAANCLVWNRSRLFWLIHPEESLYISLTIFFILGKESKGLINYYSLTCWLHLNEQDCKQLLQQP